MTEQELYNEYRKSDCKSFTDFLINKISELEAEKDKDWWEGFDTCKAKAGEANVKLSDEINLLKAQIEKMKCGGNCEHLYHVNTGGCYDAKCDLTYCDCINCKDKWELRR